MRRDVFVFGTGALLLILISACVEPIPTGTSQPFEPFVHEIGTDVGLVVTADAAASEGSASKVASSSLIHDTGVSADSEHVYVRMRGPSASQDAVVVRVDTANRIYPSQWSSYEWVEAHTNATGTIALEAVETGVLLDVIVVSEAPLTEQELDELINVSEFAVPPTSSLIGPQPVEGYGDGDYYVSIGGNDNNAGTIDAPLATMQEAVDRVQPGDVVYVRAGTYRGPLIRDLTATAQEPIVFSAYPGEHVVFDAHLGTRERMIFLLFGENHHLVFDGFELTDTDPLIDEARMLDMSDPSDIETWQAEYLPRADELFTRPFRSSTRSDGSASHLTFRNLDVHGFMDIAFSLDTRTSDVTIEQSHIRDLGLPKSGYAVYAHGDRLTFRNNIVERTVYGLHLYGSNEMSTTRIENNVFSDIGNEAYWHISSDRVKSGGTAVFVDGPGTDTRIVNNVITNSSSCLSIDTTDTFVAHNLIYGCDVAVRVNEPTIEFANTIIHSSTTRYAGTDDPVLRNDDTTETRLVDVLDPQAGLTVEPPLGIDVGVTSDMLGSTRSGPRFGPLE